MLDAFLTTLREKKTDTADFRAAAHKLAELLAAKTGELIPEEKVKITTPIAKGQGSRIPHEIILLPVLRSGLALLPAFLRYFESARVGFVGMKRDEKTAIAHEYYRSIPPITKKSLIILLDPMLATGGTAVDTITLLKKAGAKESQIIFVVCISAPEGEKIIRKKFPKVRMVIGAHDKKLNAKKYIIPGMGDFGDRYFNNL